MNCRTSKLMERFSIALVGMACVIVASFGAFIQPAWAEAQSFKELCKGTQTFVLPPAGGYGFESWSFAGDKPGKVSAVKVGNSKVLKVKKYKFKAEGKWYGGLTLFAKKAGKSNLTFKFKSKKYKAKVKFVKYRNPFKTLKVGTKNYTACFKNRTYAVEQKQALSGKIVIKPAKKWKVKRAVAYFADNTEQKLKNGSTLKAKAGYKSLVFIMKNKKTGAEEIVELNESIPETDDEDEVDDLSSGDVDD